MPTKSIGRAKLVTKGGKTKLQPTKAHRSVSQKLGAKAKADRAEKRYRANASHSQGGAPPEPHSGRRRGEPGQRAGKSASRRQRSG